MWRACNDLLPTKMNLLKHGAVFDALCPICTRDVENVKHIFWSCYSVQDVSMGAGLKSFKKVRMGVILLFIFLRPLWNVVT
jgi:hypothetical protein